MLLFAPFALPAAPRSPQPARSPQAPHSVSATNGVVSVECALVGGKLATITLRDLTTDHKSDMSGFSLRLTGGRMVRSSDLLIERGPVQTTLVADKKALRFSERFPGQALTISFVDRQKTFHAEWRVVIREGAHYLREELTVLPDKTGLESIEMIDLPAAAAVIEGSVDGSPIATDQMFFGIEDPMATSEHRNDRLVNALSAKTAVGQRTTCKAVIGFITGERQLRRDFLNYLERERAHPYRPFLHYNTWYDIGYFNAYDEAAVLDRVQKFGTELVKKRGAKMRSFLLDDGWDDHKTLWSFHSGFPQGLTAVAKACATYGFAPGMWLSPWGGYGDPKKERIEFGKTQGYAIVNGSFSMADPKYYQTFRDLCVDVVKNYGVNQFKFDGIGSDDSHGAGSARADFEAMLQLTAELHALRPDIYINQTTGTWPSPFWLLRVDSIWRGGDDHDFAGPGSKRQQWITYRDSGTYKNIVQKGKLYPLNSLMLHGIIYAKQAKNLDTDPSHDFVSEVRSYFGTGTQLQELYITPDLLTARDWDALAAAARWAAANADTLKDSHWIGGDPAAGMVYGWAAWSAKKGILTLRNPGENTQKVSIEPLSAFDLPEGAAKRYELVSPYPDQPVGSVQQLNAEEAAEIELKPYQVLVLEAMPRL